jgi:hypothetical protein
LVVVGGQERKDRRSVEGRASVADRYVDGSRAGMSRHRVGAVGRYRVERW